MVCIDHGGPCSFLRVLPVQLMVTHHQLHKLRIGHAQRGSGVHAFEHLPDVFGGQRISQDLVHGNRMSREK